MGQKVCVQCADIMHACSFLLFNIHSAHMQNVIIRAKQVQHYKHYASKMCAHVSRIFV